MSTRAVIAEPSGDSWRGRYHHFDGYPSGLGKGLWDLYHGEVFQADAERMRQVLVRDHPAGWSTILDADWSQPAGYGKPGPKCYCHGERSEDPIVIVPDSPGWDIEYGYIICDRALIVFDPRQPLSACKLRWRGPEPDWNRLEATLTGSLVQPGDAGRYEP